MKKNIRNFTSRNKQDEERKQLTIPFQENEHKKYLLKQLVNESVDSCLRKYLNENLKTHKYRCKESYVFQPWDEL